MTGVSKIIETDIMVYQIVEEYKTKHDGNSPTLEEISLRSNLSSKSHIHSILKKLERAGYLKYKGIRQIELTGGFYALNANAETPILGLHVESEKE